MPVLAAAAVVIFWANLLALLALVLLRPVRRSKVALVAVCALGFTVAVCVWDAYKIEPYAIGITRHVIRTPKLPLGTRVRIAQLSDLHILGISSRELRMMNHTAYEGPDLIVMTGDYTSAKTPAVYDSLTQIAGRLSGTAPAFAVDGNWDLSVDRKALRDGGVTYLDKWTTFTANGATIAIGPADWRCGKRVEPPPESMAGMYKLMLTHMPYRFADTAKLDADLTLAGHSHGGQVRIPFVGSIMADRTRVGKYVMGMFQRGRSRLYVSRGIGMVGGGAPQVRFLCPPEIPIFDIIGTGPARHVGAGHTSTVHGHHLISSRAARRNSR